jgi:hypothetical protein
MAFIFRCILNRRHRRTLLSCVAGDDFEDVAVMEDPGPEVDYYLQPSREEQVPIAHPIQAAFSRAEKDHSDAPWGVLTSDSLFVSSAGRPKLLRNGEAKNLTEQQFSIPSRFFPESRGWRGSYMRRRHRRP